MELLGPWVDQQRAAERGPGGHTYVNVSGVGCSGQVVSGSLV